ncbi:ThiF family adenylyltransferase [Pedobacter gandavensis]|uniref:ThiF family adenylyltransferase n=1 Tax=Pedobacter gandavensis TaxID=2679963 RepID=UPI00247A6DE9|nr:ThiF family adenylyltransferase [Pedobacter gandavensis]WGQ11867.1 ThiF family adenylyltransferase [Pedobacter gandavensis]
MQHQLINHSPDLKHLRDEGYDLEVKGGYVCIHHIPYVNAEMQVKFGSLISALSLVSPTSISKPADHTAYFMGEMPCHKNGMPYTSIVNHSQTTTLVEGLVGNHFLSSKPECGFYSDFYDKLTRYAKLISAPAKSLDRNVTATPFNPFRDDREESAFNYFDTNSSRANIVQVNAKLSGQKIVIIGMGGTGSYILDQVAKTPVAEIHLYDGDVFSQHNAFRSPGAPSIEELDLKKNKAEYFAEIYSKMHKGIIPHVEYITKENVRLLKDASYVFICVDNNSARRDIIEELLKLKVSFIDVGLGVTLVDDHLIGIVRTTTGTELKNDHLCKRIPLEETEENEYATNIQIADLNALNAIMAVIKWKKLSSFYQDLIEEHQTTYSINVAQLLNGDTTA